jgi:DNA helicase-2/ATP-dependent DNA helicase PcrA
MSVAGPLEAMLAQANDAQRQAIETRGRRVLVVAGAGTGKTYTLVGHAASLLVEGVPAERILCVTFTNKAADEMRERLTALLPGYELPAIRTLHSFCGELLRQEADALGRDADFSIYDDYDYIALLRAASRNLGDAKWKSRRVKTLEKTKTVTTLVRGWLDESNAFTFSDLEARALRLLKEDPEVHARWLGRYEHLLMDETQDTSAAQYLIVERLEPAHTFYVADPRQRIYGWRGADGQKLVELSNDGDTVVIRLRTNYRSTPEIVDVGNRLATGDWGDLEAAVGTQEHTPRVLQAQTAGETAEAAVRALGSLEGKTVAVLGRRWADLREISARFHAVGIPHLIYDPSTDDAWSSRIGRRTVRALGLVQNPADNVAARSLANWGEQRWSHLELMTLEARATRERTHLFELLGEASPAWMRIYTAVLEAKAADTPGRPCDWADLFFRELDCVSHQAGTDIVDTLRNWGTIPGFLRWWVERSVQERVQWDSPVVHLLTVHASKGLEFDYVVVANVVDGSYPSSRKDADPDEDQRVLYVACTRARERLLLTVPKVKRVSWGAGVTNLDPSPFLGHLPHPIESWPCTPKK